MDLVEHLSSDAGQQTLHYMLIGDLSMLCRVCKASQFSAIPFLYRRVELLFHIIRHENMGDDQLDNFTDCYRRQRIFCETILARPDLASLVRELSWTISFPVLPAEPLKPRTPPVLPDPDNEFQPPTDPFQSARPDQVWQTFLLLENVGDLDLRVHDDTNFEPSAQHSTPSPISNALSTLFPNAHMVKLSGTCGMEFAKAVLPCNLAQIRHLAIDHLTFHKIGVTGWPALVQRALPMLTSLTFRKIGASSAEERAAFTELATVLESARQSLRSIYIGSTSPPQGCIIYLNFPPVSQINFQDLVLPT